MLVLVVMLYPFQCEYSKPISIWNVFVEIVKPGVIIVMIERVNLDVGILLIVGLQNLHETINNLSGDYVGVVNEIWIRTGTVGMILSGLLLIKSCWNVRFSFDVFNFQYSRQRAVLMVIGLLVFGSLQLFVVQPGQMYLERLERFKYDDLEREYHSLFNNGVAKRPWLGYDYELLGKRIRLWKDSNSNKVLQEKIEKSLFPWIQPRFKNSQELKDYGNGEGIVISVPNRYVKDAVSTLKMIRTILNCDLPVEVFFVGNDDLSPQNQALLETIPKVEVVDLNKLFNTDILNIKGYGIKPFCILGSKFQNVILIDADVVFLQSPSVLFKTYEFIQYGALFFWDRQLLGDWDPIKSQQLFIKSILDRPLRQTVKDMDIFEGKTFNTQESGVVVIDKKRGFEALMATCAMNAGKLREDIYKLINGDKETFWIGYEIVEVPYSFTKHISGAMGISRKMDSGRYEVCSTQILHVDNNKKPLWFNGGLLVNKNLKEKNSQDFIELNEWMTELDGEWVYYHGGGGCLRTRLANTRPVLFEKEEKDLFKQITALYA